MSADRLHIRTTSAFRARLETLAQERHTTMSGVIKGLVMLLLREAARCGSVPAMKELRAYHRERAAGDQDGLARFDELAARRTAT